MEQNSICYNGWMGLQAHLPQDRLRALANHQPLPDRMSGAALFADISCFTALTESLHNSLGTRRRAEELSKQLDAVYSALILEVEIFGGSVLGFAGDAIICWFDEYPARLLPALGSDFSERQSIIFRVLYFPADSGSRFKMVERCHLDSFQRGLCLHDQHRQSNGFFR